MFYLQDKSSRLVLFDFILNFKERHFSHSGLNNSWSKEPALGKGEPVSLSKLPSLRKTAFAGTQGHIFGIPFLKLKSGICGRSLSLFKQNENLSFSLHVCPSSRSHCYFAKPGPHYLKNESGNKTSGCSRFFSQASPVGYLCLDFSSLRAGAMFIHLYFKHLMEPLTHSEAP